MPTWSHMERLCPKRRGLIRPRVGRLTFMERRTLGKGLEVSAIGLGCMGMAEVYGARDEQEALDTIHRALDLGVTLLDTADMYGPFTNEKLLARAIAGPADEAPAGTHVRTVS